MIVRYPHTLKVKAVREPALWIHGVSVRWVADGPDPACEVDWALKTNDFIRTWWLVRACAGWEVRAPWQDGCGQGAEVCGRQDGLVGPQDGGPEQNPAVWGPRAASLSGHGREEGQWTVTLGCLTYSCLRRGMGEGVEVLEVGVEGYLYLTWRFGGGGGGGGGCT